MLSDLSLQNFRCFDSLTLGLEPGLNFVIGANGEGKSSILEAACVTLRLQSQRSSSLAPLVKFGQKSFAVAGRCGGHHLRFHYAGLRRKTEFDHVEQRNSQEYLQVGRVVSLANTDIELARGTSEARRRFLDFLGMQIDPRYRPALRAYERALRSRNALLKSPQSRSREIAAYDPPLVANGLELLAMRRMLVERLAPCASSAHRRISRCDEALELRFVPGAGDDFAEALVRSREEESRLRQTVVGPHRDDVEVLVEGMLAQRYASEGQQRTVALALKIAQARVLADEVVAPLLLVDDIFGELDPDRRNALFAELPAESQKIVTATTLNWLKEKIDAPVLHLENGRISYSRNPGTDATLAQTGWGHFSS